jgi:hypothetical protein
LLTYPHQHRPVLVYRKPFGFNNFVFEVFEILVIEVETPLHGTIRDSFLPLEQCKYLGEDFIEGHGVNLRCLGSSSVLLLNVTQICHKGKRFSGERDSV